MSGDTNPKPDFPKSDHLTLRIGQWFEASASGRLAILATILIAGAILAATGAGWISGFSL